MQNRLNTLQNLARPLWVKVSGISVALAGVWQFGCDQLGWPRLPQAWAIVDAHVPWWGWLITLQTIFVASLFEYVRRNTSFVPATSETAHSSELLDSVEAMLSEKLGFYDIKVEQIRVDTAIVTSDLKKLAAKTAKSDEKIMGSFFALQARERLATLESQIEEDAAKLYDSLKAGEVYSAEKWQQWEVIHKQWNERLNEWLAIGTWYAEEVKARTLTIDESLYAAKWSIAESQFPDAEAVRKFRKHRITLMNLREIIPQVRRGVDLVAFSGMSEVDVRNGRAAA